jgi:hypothetical protein
MKQAIEILYTHGFGHYRKWKRAGTYNEACDEEEEEEAGAEEDALPSPLKNKPVRNREIGSVRDSKQTDA